MPTRTLVFTLAVLLGACNNGGGGAPDTGAGGGDSGGSDPLIGSWFQQVTTGSDNQTETWTFASGGTLTAVHSQVDVGTADHAGCTEVWTEMGTFVESADRTMVTISSRVGDGTQTYSGCTSAADNGTGPYTGTGTLPTSTVTYPFTITGNTLAVGPTGSASMFTRQ